MEALAQIYEAEHQITGADPKNALPHHDDSIEIIQTWSDGGFFIIKNNPHKVSITRTNHKHYTLTLSFLTHKKSLNRCLSFIKIRFKNLFQPFMYRRQIFICYLRSSRI